MKNLKNLLLKTLSSIDVYASRAQLTIFKKSKNSSFLSIFLSFIVTMITLLILYDDIRSVFNQLKPQVLNTQQNQQEPPVYKLLPDNFTYALVVGTNGMGTLQGVGVFYNYALQYCHRKRFANNSFPITNCTKVPLEQCSLNKHFNNSVQKEYFKQYNFTDMRCINIDWWKKNEIVIKKRGVVYSTDYYYMNLQVYTCNNLTKSQFSQECPSQDQIAKKLEGAFFTSYVSTNQIDHSKIGSPYTQSIKFYYTTISLSFMKTQVLTYSSSQTQTDVGYFSQAFEYDDALVISDKHEYSDTIPKSQLMFNQVIILDDVSLIALRQYDKIQKVIGQIGGLWSVLFQLTYMIFFPFIDATTKLNLIDWFTKINTKVSSPLSCFSKKKLNQNLEDEPFNFIKRLKDIIKIAFGFKIKQTEYLNMISDHLDINFIIEKLLDVEQLKQIILDPNFMFKNHSFDQINFNQESDSQNIRRSKQQTPFIKDSQEQQQIIYHGQSQQSQNAGSLGFESQIQIYSYLKRKTLASKIQINNIKFYANSRQSELN